MEKASTTTMNRRTGQLRTICTAADQSTDGVKYGACTAITLATLGIHRRRLRLPIRWSGRPRPPGAVVHIGLKPLRAVWQGGRKPMRFQTGAKARLSLPEEQAHDDRKDYRQDDAGGDRDIDRHVSAAKGEVAWQVEPAEEHQAAADHREQHAKDQEQAPDVLHGFNSTAYDQLDRNGALHYPAYDQLGRSGPIPPKLSPKVGGSAAVPGRVG